MANKKNEASYVLMTAQAFVALCNQVDELPTKYGKKIAPLLGTATPVNNAKITHSPDEAEEVEAEETPE